MLAAPQWHEPTNLKKLEVFIKGSTCGGQWYGKPYMALYWLDFRDPDDTDSKDPHPSLEATRSSKQSKQNRNGCERSSVAIGLPKAMSAPILCDGVGEPASSKGCHSVAASAASFDPWDNACNSTRHSGATFLAAFCSKSSKAVNENSGCSEDETRQRVIFSNTTTEGSVRSEEEERTNLAYTSLWIADNVLFSNAKKSDASSIFSPIFENGQYQGHAEDNLMRHLSTLLSNIDLRKLACITIMQNASPCFRCALKYLECFNLHLDQTKVRIHFVCASLYRLKRPSCVARQHPHQMLSLDQHRLQRIGLQRLIDAGSILKAPTFPDWQRLATALQVPLDRFFWRSEAEYRDSPRGLNDSLLQRDLEDILPMS